MENDFLIPIKRASIDLQAKSCSSKSFCHRSDLENRILIDLFLAPLTESAKAFGKYHLIILHNRDGGTGNISLCALLFDERAEFIPIKRKSRSDRDTE